MSYAICSLRYAFVRSPEGADTHNSQPVTRNPNATHFFLPEIFYLVQRA
jgi:hypothetical protein